MKIFYSQSSENVRMLLLELLSGRNLLVLLSIFPADTIDHNCLIHKESYMHSLNVFKNLHSRLLCKELLLAITKCLKKIWLALALGWSYVV